MRRWDRRLGNIRFSPKATKSLRHNIRRYGPKPDSCTAQEELAKCNLRQGLYQKVRGSNPSLHRAEVVLDSLFGVFTLSNY
jgi:hypothetical protein